MGDKSKIEWTDATWNPVRGCSRVSPGCENCYAERMASRFCGSGQPYEGLVKVHVRRSSVHVRRSSVDPRVKWSSPRWTGEVRMVPEHLADPLRWKRPRRVFVNSMSDLFHERLKNEEIAAVFGVMAAAPRHTFQVLTKRAERMRDWFRWLESQIAPPEKVGNWTRTGHGHRDVVHYYVRQLLTDDAAIVSGEARTGAWPLPNVWLGVSVENQQYADERIPLLLETPAAVRFVSAEPLLGDVDLGLSSATCTCCQRRTSRWIDLERGARADMLFDDREAQTYAEAGIYRANSNPHGALSVKATDGKLLGVKPDEFRVLPGLDWVIVGAESGPGARAMQIDWARGVRDQCAAAGVPFFLKQFATNGRKVHMPELDGRRHEEWPR
jgi:protein gp37